MPKKSRIKGTTYHLVQPSYADQLQAIREGRDEVPTAVWVTDAEFKRAQGAKSKHSNNTNTNESSYFYSYNNNNNADEYCNKNYEELPEEEEEEEEQELYDEDEWDANNDAFDEEWEEEIYDDDDDDEENDWFDEEKGELHDTIAKEEEQNKKENKTTSTSAIELKPSGIRKTIEIKHHDNVLNRDRHVKLVEGENKEHTSVSNFAKAILANESKTSINNVISNKNKSDNTIDTDDDDDDKLFDDEVECEVTDDFLHTLVFGDGNTHITTNNNNEEEREKYEDKGNINSNVTMAIKHSSELPCNGKQYNIDEEMWALMTEDERQAVQMTHKRGTDRRRGQLQHSEQLEEQVCYECSANDFAETTHDCVNDSTDANDINMHETESGALESQFTKMMQEFNVDAAINDADYDDVRTHGPLSMAQYMGALEEFVKDRAGIDLQTSEPYKNKGLIQQLKLLATRAGVFDTDSKGGVFRTTVVSDKESRFAEEYQRESERIRAEAQRRVEMQQRQRKSEKQKELLKEFSVSSPSTAQQTTQNNESQEMITDKSKTNEIASYEETMEEDMEDEYTFINVKSKADRLDCETAVSAYSTYYNQPNVIAPPHSNRNKNKKKKLRTNVAFSEPSDIVEQATSNVKNNNNYLQINNYSLKGNMEEYMKANKCIIHKENETKEERRLRQKAVKAIQRERRREKAERKKVYKHVEAEELKRETASRAAKSTVHFTYKKYF